MDGKPVKNGQDITVNTVDVKMRYLLTETHPLTLSVVISFMVGRLLPPKATGHLTKIPWLLYELYMRRKQARQGGVKAIWMLAHSDISLQREKSDIVALKRTHKILSFCGREKHLFICFKTFH